MNQKKTQQKIQTNKILEQHNYSTKNKLTNFPLHASLKSSLMRRAKHTTSFFDIPLAVCFSFLLFVMMGSVSASVVINQVLYYPTGTYTGGEAVELYNTADIPIDISGFRLDTTSREADVTIPAGSIIPANGFFLIADTGWSEKRDSITYPLADHEQAMTLRLTNGGVALVDTQGIVRDAVGWGSAEGIGEPFYLGVPANPVERGYSLIRINSTNSNADDFKQSLPRFTNSLGLTSPPDITPFTINLEVIDAYSFIRNISLATDMPDSIVLFPGKERVIPFSFDVHYSDEHTVLVQFNHDHIQTTITNNSYHGEITLPHYTTPGNYSLNITLEYDEGTLSRTIPLNVLPLLSFGVSLPSVTCELVQGSSCTFIGDTDPLSENPTIMNYGNVALDFSVSSSPEVVAGTGIPSENIKYSFSTQPETVLQTTPQLHSIGLSPGINSLLPFSLQITGEVSAGKYTTQLIIVGVPHE
ncbi:MAG: lamin tail domain-containing protein [Candidatus Woesearchaeota archaeon]